jgi:hypothetical protein
VAGWLLVSGLVTFTIGAVRWRLEYEQPLAVSLPLRAADRGRLRWIQYWMIIGVAVTSMGLAAAAAVLVASPWAAVAAALYGIGAAAFLIALAFRLTVGEWAAAETVATGQVPLLYPALSAWAAGLYGLHMITAYISAIPLGFVIAAATGPNWLGWAGVVWGGGCATGFVLTRGAGFFSPPILAHVFSAAVGMTLLIG